MYNMRNMYNMHNMYNINTFIPTTLTRVIEVGDKRQRQVQDRGHEGLVQERVSNLPAMIGDEPVVPAKVALSTAAACPAAARPAEPRGPADGKMMESGFRG